MGRGASWSVILVGLALSGCGDPDDLGRCRTLRARRPAPDAAPLRCNGSPSLCDRPYDQVFVPAAHNAMSNSDEGWYVPNQHHGIGRALADGIRGLELDTHYDAHGAPSLCHGPCEAGRRPLTDALCEVTGFLDDHPDEVVTLLLESYIGRGDTVEAFARSGLDAYVLSRAPGEPWPTLGEMIRGGRRLVVLTEADGGTPRWYQPLFEVGMQSTYRFRAPTDFDCALDPRSRGRDLFIVKHFLADPLSDETLALRANAAEVLAARLARCRREEGRLPTLVAVDFYDEGDLLPVVESLNAGVRP